MSEITMKQLLESGVHFGHQTNRWNPKMKPYIYGARSGIYIIDLQKTLACFQEAEKSIREMARAGKKILFVATKNQAQELIAEEATRCGMYYINQRWLGGTLTNFSTIRKSIARLHELEKMDAENQFDLLHKKEALRLRREIEKLNKFFRGIKDMKDLIRGTIYSKLENVIDAYKFFKETQGRSKSTSGAVSLKVDNKTDQTNKQSNNVKLWQ